MNKEDWEYIGRRIQIKTENVRSDLRNDCILLLSFNPFYPWQSVHPECKNKHRENRKQEKTDDMTSSKRHPFTIRAKIEAMPSIK